MLALLGDTIMSELIVGLLVLIVGGALTYTWSRRGKEAVVDHQVGELDEDAEKKAETVIGIEKQMVEMRLRLEYLERNPAEKIVEKVIEEIRLLRGDIQDVKLELTKHDGKFISRQECADLRKECRHGG